MKRLIYNLFFLSMIGIWTSCSEDESVWKNEGGGAIKLQFTEGILSRAADTPMERAISHLDVFIYNAGSTGPTDIKYERISNPTVSGEDNEGTVTLTAQLSEFTNRADNYVYVIANAKQPFTGNETIAQLEAMIQEDERIHVTGTTAAGAPTHFLMDGMATGGNSTIQNAVHIDANSTEDIILKVTLKRAAAKVVVTLSQSANSDYKFLQDPLQNYEMGYYFRNMPYKTKLLGGLNEPYPDWTAENDYLRIPDKANDSAFKWGENTVVVTAYVYSHRWGNVENNNYHARGTSLVVNIPLWEDKDKDGKVDLGENGNSEEGTNGPAEPVYMNSYYQIPVVEGNNLTDNDKTKHYWAIDRNTLYTITATIEAPGAEDNKQPHTLNNLKYQVQDWTAVPVNVGGEVAPKYLEVNKNLLEMHNVAKDATLTFTSSSPITSVEVSNAYYYNKYGEKKTFTASDSISNPVWNTNVLSGSITINSIIPKNLTARYFTLTVRNADGNSETIKVIQYPVICVSNQLGWYSYREDFNFNWESRSTQGAYVSVGATYNNRDQYTGNYYGTRAANNNGEDGRNYLDYFFNSKVIETINADNQNNRTHTSRFYNGTKNTNNCETHNMRMYQMQVMATSDEYVVGKPRINADGYTDRSVENNKLVSPSFMIASRLGAVYSGYGNTDELESGGDGGLVYNAETGSFVANSYNINSDQLLKFYEDHCKNYVEVVGTANNKKVYKDWRLPTSAEIIFIINNQGTSGQDADAIDYLLNGAYYYSANGPVYNSKQNQAGKAIRCVHDVYDSSLVISKKE